jgi:raffinose/stachyose/melibiose transport system permease protein
MMMNKKLLDKNKNLIPYFYIMPAIFVILFIYLGPFLFNTFMTFTDWDGISRSFNIIYFKNYVEVFKTKEILVPFLNTLKFAAVSIILQNLVALTLAILLNESFFGSNIAKVIVFIPTITNTVAVGKIWQLIFNPMNGPLTALFDNLGLDFLSDIRWIGNPNIVLYSIVLVNTWQWFGYNFILYSAGLKCIPEEINEAASIDGASYFSKIMHITIPLLVPTITINLVLTTIGTLKIFELPYVMTSGGPGRASETFVMSIINYSFYQSKVGFGATLTLFLFIIILFISIIQNKGLFSVEKRLS